MENGKLGGIEEINDWLAEFRCKNARAPRILHIGNIANNAYNNAKLLNKVGFDCDVICYDYYHIMGCPEWEDADFKGDVGDHFRPKWRNVELGNYERPRWFAQGPLPLCIKYLVDRRMGAGESSSLTWDILSRINHTRSRRWCDLRFWYTSARLVIRRVFFAALNPVTVSRRLDQLHVFVSRELARRLYRNDGAYHEKLGILRDLFSYIKKAHVYVSRHMRSKLLPKLYRVSPLDNQKFDDVIARYNKAFPHRKDSLTYDDLMLYGFELYLWRRLLKLYDIVVAYSIDPIFPLLAGYRYFALEHGTLREIPFRNDSQGRLTALAYHEAEHCFVTNFDCIKQARELCETSFSFINHPYDEDHGITISGFDLIRDRLCAELDAEFLVFFPTRHDWVQGTGYADKANDRMLRALGQLRRMELRIGMVCCNWGANVSESRDLLRQCGVDRYVSWHEPMGTVAFERTAKACDIVVDQFMLGAFGGVTFKALAVGAPVCTYIDPVLLEKLFQEMPPVINCRNEDEIIEAIKVFTAEPHKLKEIGRRSRDWIEKHHSSRDVVMTQAGKFINFIKERDADKEKICVAN